MMERIWLQVGEEAIEEMGETTWCQDKINNNDIEYVLASKLEQVETEREGVVRWLSNCVFSNVWDTSTLPDSIAADVLEMLAESIETPQVARKAIALMLQSNMDLARATELATLAKNAATIAGINSSEALE